MGVPRRSLNELITKYDLHPELRGLDVYVEGELDLVLYGEMTRKSGAGLKLKFYTAKDIDLPSELLESYGLTVGDKQRVCALARYLMGSLSNEHVDVRCIVDQDTDAFFGGGFMTRNLLKTDYSSVEMYLSADPALERFASAFLKNSNRVQLIREVASAAYKQLPLLLCIRLALIDLGKKVEWISVEDQVSRDKGLVGAQYLKKIANKVGEKGFEAKLKAKVDEWVLKVRTLPPKQQVYGKDFIKYLWGRLKKSSRFGSAADESAFAHALALNLDWDDVRAEPLFMALCQQH